MASKITSWAFLERKLRLAPHILQENANTDLRDARELLHRQHAVFVLVQVGDQIVGHARQGRFAQLRMAVGEEFRAVQRVVLVRVRLRPAEAVLRHGDRVWKERGWIDLPSLPRTLGQRSRVLPFHVQLSNLPSSPSGISE